MNELDAIRALDDTVPRRIEDLPGAADRLRAAITDDGAMAPSEWTHVPDRRRRRWLGAAAAAVAVVAITAGAIAVVHTGSNGANRTAADQPSPHTTSTSAEPIDFLQKAATAALAQPDYVPRPDQFLYIQQPGYQAWLSIDGTHDGLIDNGQKIPSPGCRSGVAMVAGNYSGLRPTPCVIDPAYIADAPTTAAAMAAYILAKAGSSDANNVGKEVLDLVEFHYLRPAAQAALYEAVRLLPQLAVAIVASTDHPEAGVVAVSWIFGDDPATTLLFDPTTYVYLGVTTAKLPADVNVLKNDRQGIVDSVGQVP